MHKQFIILGSVCALLAVALGAFGAHGLEATLDDKMLSIFETGVKYHMYHALGLLVIAALSMRMPQSRQLLWAGRLIFCGILIFSGSLYVLSMTGITALGMITPIGGVLFIVGWALVAISAIKMK
ncbi:DUF423 domain-containing protein [Paenibacillus sp. J2TS4]|uniref:DUF423 domain-containing protein n=1 Tax=Paenibacillus sp. J2TS4 TaxID=2807194 RepID=UPI001B2F4992|nr:DUF423 domain-containing protein [Paenibacillus sp. J2TS4]GIP36219.1 UPF0382 membrane protein YwdK [Paenibacillus sp. J2TS4]